MYDARQFVAIAMFGWILNPDVIYTFAATSMLFLSSYIALSIFFCLFASYEIPFKSNYADSICNEYSIFRYLLLKYQIIIRIAVLHAFECVHACLRTRIWWSILQTQQQQQKIDDDKHWALHYK